MSAWVIVAGDFSPTGGMDRANYHLARYLAESGREVTLVAHRVAEPLATHPAVRVVRVVRPLGSHALGGLLLDRAGRAEARRQPRARVVVNGANCVVPAVNWVHMVHHACPPSDGGAPWAFRLKSWLTRRRERRREREALAVSRLVLANSHKTARDVAALGVPEGRIEVVYLGTDAEFRPATAAERDAARAEFGLPPGPMLLFVGALGYDRNKGFDTLLAAWARAGQPGTLVAAGGGRLDWWRGRAERLGVAGTVRLVGQTPRVAALMAAADGFVSPTRYDAYGLAVHEALCRGVPALVTRAAGVAERYPPALSGLVLPDPEDVGELASRLRALAEGGPRVEALGAELRNTSWDDMAGRIVGLAEGLQ